MQSLYEKYADQGLVILGFPCNQFGKQEPENEAAILRFVQNLGVTFPIMSKVKVNGSDTHPIFLFLRAKLGGTLGSTVKWNFTKFLCDRKGVPQKRFGPPTKPFDFEEDIIEMLKSDE